MPIFDFLKILDYVRQIRETCRGNESFGIKRLLPAEEQGRLRGGLRHVEATLVAGAVYSAGQRTSGGPEEKRSRKEDQIKVLEQYALHENIYFESPEEAFGDPMAGGSEQTVYPYPPDPGKIVKINDMSFHPDPLGFLDRIALHNVLFPEIPYTLIGFSRRHGHRFAAAITQPIVVGRASYRKEVNDEMIKRGFRHVGGTDYYSDNYIIEDLHAGNVLVSNQGNLLFIDPVVYLNQEEDDLGGNRSPGEIEIGVI